MKLDDIKRMIEEHISESTAYILDPKKDGQHLEALVIAPIFEGMPLLTQQKKVMEILKPILESTVHAMSLKTFTPAKWETVKNNYNFEGEKNEQ
jgi:acid stress-induced BolA-like protein IbaG/YrbA